MGKEFMTMGEFLEKKLTKQYVIRDERTLPDLSISFYEWFNIVLSKIPFKLTHTEVRNLRRAKYRMYQDAKDADGIKYKNWSTNLADYSTEHDKSSYSASYNPEETIEKYPKYDSRLKDGDLTSWEGSQLQEPLKTAKTIQDRDSPIGIVGKITERIRRQEMFLHGVFSDVNPDEVIIGPTEIYGLKLKDIVDFNYGDNNFANIMMEVGRIMNTFPDKSIARIQSRSFILYKIAEIISIRMRETGVIDQSFYQQCSFGTYTVPNADRKDKLLTESLKAFDSYTRRQGKIGITDYELKFAYRPKKDAGEKAKPAIFIDAEGILFEIHPFDGYEMSSSQEGIYVSKITPTTPSDKPFTLFPLPTEGAPTVVETLNGAFFHSTKDFMEIYKKNFKLSYEASSEDERSFNIKKLVGRMLFNGGITEVSHGLLSTIVGYSLNREAYYLCSSDGVISEVLNVCRSNMDQSAFTKAVVDAGLSVDMLTNHDYIIRKTQVGSGSGRASPRPIKHDKIRATRQTGIGDIKNSLLDLDLILYNETGLAIFSTREAAERCVKYGGGDIDKYIQYIQNKNTSKVEKNVFVDNLKNAALMGAGAAIPRLAEAIYTGVKAATNVSAISTVAGCIMKPMLPPMAGTVAGFISSGAIASMISSGSIAAIGTVAIPLAGIAVAGTIIYNLGDGKMENLFNGMKEFFNGVKEKMDARRAEKGGIIGGTIETAKEIIGGIKDFVVGIGKFIVKSVKKVISPVEAKGVVGKVTEVGGRIIGVGKEAATNAINIVKGAGVWVWGKVTGIGKGVKNFFGKLFGKKTTTTTTTVTAEETTTTQPTKEEVKAETIVTREEVKAETVVTTAKATEEAAPVAAKVPEAPKATVEEPKKANIPVFPEDEGYEELYGIDDEDEDEDDGYFDEEDAIEIAA